MAAEYSTVITFAGRNCPQRAGQTHSKLRVLIESRDEARDRFRL